MQYKNQVIMYTLTLEHDEMEVQLPSFTFSHTLPGHERKSVWVSGQKVKEELQSRGINVSKQTLFNLEEKNILTTKRLSPRKVLFNLDEVLNYFHTAS